MSLFNFACRACVCLVAEDSQRRADLLLEAETPSADKIRFWSVPLQGGKESRDSGFPDGKLFIEYFPPSESASPGNQEKSPLQVLYALLLVSQQPNYRWLVA